MDRPPPDPAKLLSAWTETLSGEVTPGRGLANLKTGGFPDVLALAVEADAADALGPISDAWSGWERGEIPPAEVVAALHGAGLQDLLERIAAGA